MNYILNKEKVIIGGIIPPVAVRPFEAKEGLNMKLNGIHHIAVNTIDIDASVAFYRDMLGFTEDVRADMGDFILVYMKINESSFMELFEFKNGSCSIGGIDENMQGFRHVAFDVNEIEKWNETLKEKGAKFTLELCEMEAIGKKGLLIQDPNGTIIELCEDL